MEVKQETSIEKRLDRLEKMVDCLCITNFMTDHEQGDEDARNDSVRIINSRAKQAKERYNVFQRYGELYWEAKEKRDEMDLLEQDFPELKSIYSEYHHVK